MPDLFNNGVDMRNYFLVVTLASFALTPAFASVTDFKPPKTCPKVSALIEKGVNDAVEDRFWFAWNTNSYKYNTAHEWTYAILLDDSTIKSKEEAIKLGTEATSTITYQKGPEEINSKPKMWFCTYTTADDHALGFAITPPSTFREISAVSKLLR